MILLIVLQVILKVTFTILHSMIYFILISKRPMMIIFLNLIVFIVNCFLLKMLSELYIHLKNGKVSVFDGIYSELIVYARNTFVNALVNLFDMSIVRGYELAYFRMSLIIPAIKDKMVKKIVMITIDQ